jgi:hypothetical protein
MGSIYFDFLQTSQVSIELEEKDAKVTELEEILTSKNKEVKQVSNQLQEVVSIMISTILSVFNKSVKFL